MNSPAATDSDLPKPPRPLETAPPDAAAHRQRSMIVSIYEGAVTLIFMTWTSGSVLTGYLLALGASPRELATAASMPHLTQLFSPFIAWLAMGVANRIRFMQITTLLGRGLWVLAVFLPWQLPIPLRPAAALVALIGLSHLIQAGAGPAWVSLMGDTVPSSIRGRYFGMRNGILAVVGMIASLSAGVYLDIVPAPGSFQFLISLAALFAVAGIALYGWQIDPGRPPRRPPFLNAVIEPLKDRGFVRFMFFSMYWSAAVMIGAPFVIPYFFAHLKMTFTQVAIWSAISAFSHLLIAPVWGRIADQVGHKTVLKVTSLLVGLGLPTCWMASAPGFLWFIWLSGVLDAFAWGGFNTAAFNMSLATAPARARMMYLAVLGAATGLTGCAAGLMSGVLLDLFQPYRFHIGRFEWTPYHNLFLVTMAMRSSAWCFLKGVPAPTGRPLGAVLREYTQRGANLLLHGRPHPE